MRYKAISQLRGLFTTELLCSVARVSKSGYYRYIGQRERYQDVKQVLKVEQEKIGYIYGYRRAKMLLQQKYRRTVNHKALQKIMRESDTNAVIRRRKDNAMYHGVGAPNVADNLLNREFKAEQIGSKYSTDITYIPIPRGMTYLSVVMDLYNGEIVTYKVSKVADAGLSCKTIEELSRKRNLQGALIHSDQGIHYTNKRYVELLKAYGSIQSMSRRGNCWDNAKVESFFGHFKCECVKLRKRALKTYEDVVNVVDEYMEFYNHHRPQLKLNKMAPVPYRHHFG